MCLLSRSYGKDRATNLILKPSMIGDSLEIIVTKAAASIGDQRSGPAVLTMAGKMTDDDAVFTAYSTAKMRLRRIRPGYDKIALSTVRGALSIDAKREGRHLFAVPGIERALPVLSACVALLRAVYKVSEAERAGIVNLPGYSPSGLFSSNDYPDEALTIGQWGRSGFFFRSKPPGAFQRARLLNPVPGLSWNRQPATS